MSEGIKNIRAEDLPRVPFILEGISSRFMRENRIIPLEMKDNTLEVVMADPHNHGAIESLEIALSARVNVCSAKAQDIEEYISRFYNRDTENITNIIDHIDEKNPESEADADVGRLKDLASEAPIIKLVNILITRAVESRGSDIHIEPFEDVLKVRYRIDGVLHDVETAPKRLQAAIVSRIKIMAGLNIAERRLPQDGRIRLTANGREIDLRVSTIPVLYGESIVMRILDKRSTIISLEALGLSSVNFQLFQELIGKANGIILVTGPTGSGKTTTLYAALDKINTPDKKIITVEDPVEYQLRGVNQIQVRPKIGLNFANTLRHIVRQDPDIIMIGEIRDLETAEIAIQSALTGHLVFSTLHTNDAPSSITRLLDIGVESFLLSSTIRGIMAQRLVRMICPNCREETDPPVKGTPAHLISGAGRFWRGKGCEQCLFTGYYGRKGIFELMMITDEIRKLIMEHSDSGRLRTEARRQGMKTLLEDGVDKVGRGETTLDEVLRVTQEA